jgi:hypothetical protein
MIVGVGVVGVAIGIMIVGVGVMGVPIGVMIVGDSLRRRCWCLGRGRGRCGRRGRCRRRGRRRLSGLATRCPAIPSSLRLLGILRLTLTPLAAPLGNRLLLLGRRGDAGIRLLLGLGAAIGRRYR